VAGQAPAGLGGENGGQGSEYSSPDGRPAVSLMVFGFAGKMYCWRPATSTSLTGQSFSQSVSQAVSQGIHMVIMTKVHWPQPRFTDLNASLQYTHETQWSEQCHS